MRTPGLPGRIVRPGDVSYPAACLPRNLAIDRTPSFIVQCRNVDEVRDAVLWAQNERLPIRVRSGRHSYEGFSTGDDVAIVDVSSMKCITVDETAGTLRVQAGVENAAVCEALDHTGRILPVGTCPSVSTVGLTLGGGWGLASRHFGLLCDSLRELSLVDYRGRLLRASPSRNADLFWASRGGGGGTFGVVVGATYELPPAVPVITFVQVKRPHGCTIDWMASLMSAWQRWLPGLDGRMTASMSLYNAFDEGLSVEGCGVFFGDESEARATLLPLRESGVSFELSRVSFSSAMRQMAQQYPEHASYKSSGRFIHEALSEQEIVAIARRLADRPADALFVSLNLYTLGGSVASLGPSETAFYHRRAQYIFGAEAAWNDGGASGAAAWAVGALAHIHSFAGGAYVNFPDMAIEAFEKSYWGENAERLRTVKRRYDPLNVFNHEQSVEPTRPETPQHSHRKP